VFDEHGIEIVESVEARRRKIAHEDAWELLKNAAEIVVGRGRKVLRFIPASDSKEDILKAVLGRTGNLRAPTLKVGECFFVGYNDEIYAALVD